MNFIEIQISNLEISIKIFLKIGISIKIAQFLQKLLRAREGSLVSLTSFISVEGPLSTVKHFPDDGRNIAVFDEMCLRLHAAA